MVDNIDQRIKLNKLIENKIYEMNPKLYNKDN